MPDGPPKAGGGVERAPADVGADQHFLDVVGCEKRRDDGMRSDDLSLNCADSVRSPGTTNETGGSDCGRWLNAKVAPGAVIDRRSIVHEPVPAVISIAATAPYTINRSSSSR